MADVLTEAELAALEALHAQATPGEWRVCDPPVPESDNGEHIAIETLAPKDDRWLSRLVVGVMYYDGPVSAVREADAALIAAAKNALPALIATVRALRAELDGLRRRA